MADVHTHPCKQEAMGIKKLSLAPIHTCPNKILDWSGDSLEQRSIGFRTVWFGSNLKNMMQVSNGCGGRLGTA